MLEGQSQEARDWVLVQTAFSEHLARSETKPSFVSLDLNCKLAGNTNGELPTGNHRHGVFFL